MNVKNVLTKKEKRQKTLTSPTGRKGSARNKRQEKKCLSGMEKKNRKKVPKERFATLGEVIKIGKNEDMYNTKFTSPVNQVSKSEWFSAKDMADFKKKLRNNKHNLKEERNNIKINFFIKRRLFGCIF